MQGYDITPILKDPKKQIRDSILIENDEEVGTLKARLRHLVTNGKKLEKIEPMPEIPKNFLQQRSRRTKILALHS